jgi:hypothetical protein
MDRGGLIQSSLVRGALITVCLLSFLAVHEIAQTYETTDGLTITVGDPLEGRVTALTIGALGIDFPLNSTGGFYLRDNTPDATGGRREAGKRGMSRGLPGGCRPSGRSPSPCRKGTKCASQLRLISGFLCR